MTAGADQALFIKRTIGNDAFRWIIGSCFSSRQPCNHFIGLFRQRRVTAQAGLMFDPVARGYIHELSQHAGAHGLSVQAVLPVQELLRMTGPTGPGVQ